MPLARARAPGPGRGPASGASRQNLESALRMCRAFNRRDLGAMLALLDEQVVIEPRFGALEGGYRGHEGVRRWWADLLGSLPDYVVEVERLDELGEGTLGCIQGRAHGAASGAPLLETWWQLARWRGGRCVGWSNFASEAEALEATGRIGDDLRTSLR